MKLKYLLVCAFALLLAAVLVGGTVRYRKQLPQNQDTQDTSVTPTRLPPVSSEVKKLEIVNAFVDEGALNIVVRNNATKGILALTVSAGTYSVTLDEGLVTDHPKTIIKPNTNFTIDIPAVNLRTTIPVVVSGVIYADNTEDGDSNVIRKIRKSRETQKLKRIKKASGGENL